MTTATDPPASLRRRTLRAPVLVLVLVLAVAVGVALVFSLVRTSGPSVSYASGVGVRLAEPVTETPALAWTTQTDDPVTGGTAVRGRVFLSTGTEVFELDSEGERAWAVRPTKPCSVILSHPDHEDVVVCATESGAVGLAAADGDQLWELSEGTVVRYLEDGAGFAGKTSLGVMDLESGDVRWSIDVTDEYAFGPDALYVAEGGDLVAYDLGSGEERWSVTYDEQSRVDGAEAGAPEIAANDDLVLLTSGAGAVALDPDDGDEVWRVDPGADGIEGGVFADDQVWLLPTDDDEQAAAPQIVVRDAEGEVGELETAEDTAVVSLERFEVDGEPYAVDFVSGRIYDQELATIGTYPGFLTLVDGGLYVATGPEGDLPGAFSYYRLGTDEPAWSIDVTGAETLNVAAADGLVVVVVDQEIRGYR